MISKRQLDKLSNIIEELHSLENELFEQEGHLLESELAEENSVLHLEGNNAGLVNFARYTLMLCTKNYPGAHSEIDEASGLSEGSVPMVIFKKYLPNEQ